MFRAKNFEMIELQIPASVTTANKNTYFQAQNLLQTIQQARTVYLKAICVYSNASMAANPLSSNPVATPADIANGALTLVSNKQLDFNLIPLTHLNLVQSDTGATFVPFVRDMFLLHDTTIVDWTQCYVQTVAAPAVVPFSYLFGVFYDYEPEIG